MLLRIEDLDALRLPPEAAGILMDDLRWLGLDWDEGPYYQNERSRVYAGYVDRLVEAGLTYPCFCSRADLHAAEAPHASDGTPVYPGTCRGLTPEEQAERLAAGRRASVRLVVPAADDPAGTVAFCDLVYGQYSECLARECGDFTIRRSDGIHAYQLAVTVDDALMGVDLVVRGSDLLPSTARQIYLQNLLGFQRPSYAHLPLLLSEDGDHRLSKREHDCDMGVMRQRFGRPEVLLGRLACLVGLRPSPEPTSARDLLDGFSWDFLSNRRGDIPVPASFFAD